METEQELRDLNDEVYRVDLNYKDNGNTIKYTAKADSQLKNNEKTKFTAGTYPKDLNDTLLT